MKHLIGTRVFTRLVVSFLLLALVPCPGTAQDPATLVTTDTGRLEGVGSGEVISFKGIPYAAPPVGELRWRPPAPPAPWTGVRSAAVFGPDCMSASIGDPSGSGTELSEDCLYLNVWRPSVIPPDTLLPTLVWIHGGGFVNGGSSDPLTDGSALARLGIVVVTLNYRLGRFGFFAHPALTAEAAGREPLGNYGYMDQHAALRWVQRNIAAFGGDPGAVTVMGESAGGQSVIDLITSHPSNRLYHRAIAMSGGGRWFLGGFPLSEGTRTNPPAEEIGLNFARGLGIRGTDTGALARLRAVPAERILAGENMLSLVVTSLLPMGPLDYARGPILDGEIVVDTAGVLAGRGHIADVQLMIGTTDFDLGMWLPSSKRAFFNWFGAEADAARALYDPDGTVDRLGLYLSFGADQTMQEPARFLARTVAARGNPAWLYRFAYVAESFRQGARGAEHASEVPYLFGTLAGRYGDAVTLADEAASRALMGYVVNFVKRGDPNGPELPAWDPVDPSEAELLLFTPEDGPVMTEDPWRERLDLVERMAESAPPPVTVAQLAQGDWTGFLGVGVFLLPEYAGSDRARFVVLPVGETAFRERLFASFGTTGLVATAGAHLLERREWRLSGHIGLAGRWLESEAGPRAGMEDRGLGTHVAATVRRGNGFLNQSVSMERGLNGGAGTTLRAGAGLVLPFSLTRMASLNASVAVADAAQMRYDFGIDAAAAARRQALAEAGDPRLDALDAGPFLPGGGLHSAGLIGSVVFLLPERWAGAVIGGATVLGGGAAESPLVRSRVQWTVGLGIGYRL